jgi:hypothetical protein
MQAISKRLLELAVEAAVKRPNDWVVPTRNNKPLRNYRKITLNNCTMMIRLHRGCFEKRITVEMSNVKAITDVGSSNFDALAKLFGVSCKSAQQQMDAFESALSDHAAERGA